MCAHGTDVSVRVKIPADLSSTGEEKWRDMGVLMRLAARLVGAEADIAPEGTP